MKRTWFYSDSVEIFFSRISIFSVSAIFSISASEAFNFLSTGDQVKTYAWYIFHCKMTIKKWNKHRFHDKNIFFFLRKPNITFNVLSNRIRFDEEYRAQKGVWVTGRRNEFRMWKSDRLCFSMYISMTSRLIALLARFCFTPIFIMVYVPTYQSK